MGAPRQRRIPEWPPSSWRFAPRAGGRLETKAAGCAVRESLMPSILAKLTALPLVSLPPASLGHTRHYMPRRGPQDRTLVFDAFVTLAPKTEVVFLWPTVILDTSEEEMLQLVLSQLVYFGRAESWCSARLSHELGTL